MTGLGIIIAVIVLIIVMIISNIIGYNHGYYDSTKHHLDLMFEKDKHINELSLTIGKLQSEIIKLKAKSH